MGLETPGGSLNAPGATVWAKVMVVPGSFSEEIPSHSAARPGGAKNRRKEPRKAEIANERLSFKGT
jgi:hypothetical protein